MAGEDEKTAFDFPKMVKTSVVTMTLNGIPGFNHRIRSMVAK
jgi:hypothetical protein